MTAIAFHRHFLAILAGIALLGPSAFGRMLPNDIACSNHVPTHSALPAWVQTIARSNQAAEVRACTGVFTLDGPRETRFALISPVVTATNGVAMRLTIEISATDNGNRHLFAWPGTPQAPLKRSGQPRTQIEMSTPAVTNGPVQSFVSVDPGITPDLFRTITLFVQAALSEPRFSRLMADRPMDEVRRLSGASYRIESYRRWVEHDGSPSYFAHFTLDGKPFGMIVEGHGVDLRTSGIGQVAF